MKVKTGSQTKLKLFDSGLTKYRGLKFEIFASIYVYFLPPGQFNNLWDLSNVNIPQLSAAIIRIII